MLIVVIFLSEIPGVLFW